jgi:hypothetical protein
MVEWFSGQLIRHCVIPSAGGEEKWRLASGYKRDRPFETVSLLLINSWTKISCLAEATCLLLFCHLLLVHRSVFPVVF